MRMALYYSGGIDWTFHGLPIARRPRFRRHPAARRVRPLRRCALARADRALRAGRAVERHRLSRAGEPPRSLPTTTIAMPEGVVNNRFTARRRSRARRTTTSSRPSTDVAEFRRESGSRPAASAALSASTATSPSDFMSGADLIHMIADVMSKNGNLLLNVGPTADGGAVGAGDAPARRRRLAAANGEAIYGTRPWTSADGRTATASPFASRAATTCTPSCWAPRRPRASRSPAWTPPRCHDRTPRARRTPRMAARRRRIAIDLPAAPTTPAFSLRISSAPSEARL